MSQLMMLVDAGPLPLSSDDQRSRVHVEASQCQRRLCGLQFRNHCQCAVAGSWHASPRSHRSLNHGDDDGIEIDIGGIDARMLLGDIHACFGTLRGVLRDLLVLLGWRGRYGLL